METTKSTPSQAEPAWDVARLFPAQGHWSEEEYLELDTNHLVEFSRGQLEVLAMPTQTHQLLVLALYTLMKQYVAERQLGVVLVAPFRMRLRSGKYREPDVLFMYDEHTSRRAEQYWNGADLVMEVVSPDEPNRDYVTKRREYAEAGIPEYWIIDPETRTVTVLILDDGAYDVHGEFKTGSQADSRLLSGFTVDVVELFAELDA